MATRRAMQIASRIVQLTNNGENTSAASIQAVADEMDRVKAETLLAAHKDTKVISDGLIKALEIIKDNKQDIDRLSEQLEKLVKLFHKHL